MAGNLVGDAAPYERALQKMESEEGAVVMDMALELAEKLDTDYFTALEILGKIGVVWADGKPS